MGNFNAVEDPLSRNDLIRTHNEQQIFACENAVFCQYIKDSMLCEKSLCKVHKIRNDLIARISPKARKLKGIACFGLFLRLARFFHGIETSSVAVIFRIRTVGNNKYLHIFKQP